MKKLSVLTWIAISLMRVLLMNCSKDLPINEGLNNELAPMERNLKGSLKAGKKLPNPYTISNMEKARQSLLSDGQIDVQLLDQIQIKATNLYVRFKIKSTKEYDVLSSEEGLELFPYPLDYDYGGSEGVIVDPEFGDKPEWLYTVVKRDYQFPEIHNMVIEELFLPESYIKQDPSKNTCLIS